MARSRGSRLLSSSGTVILVRHKKIGQDDVKSSCREARRGGRRIDDESRIILATQSVKQIVATLRANRSRVDEALKLRTSDGVVLPAQTCGSCRTR